MDSFGLIKKDISESKFFIGKPQSSGAMTVLPIFGKGLNGRFTPPLRGSKLSGVISYGKIEMSNTSFSGISIIPLHIGFIQDGAQNHALCSSSFISPGQKVLFKNACCVQESQGGYLKEKDQWFFILPMALRQEALKVRKQIGYQKLWKAISGLNKKYNLEGVGHLEKIIGGFRSFLNIYQNRFELMPNQIGAVFIIKDKLAGIEIAPNSKYFEEVWGPLVSFCYGPTVKYIEEMEKKPIDVPVPFPAATLDELKEQLKENREQFRKKLLRLIKDTPYKSYKKEEEERFLDLKLFTEIGKNFSGQYVTDKSENLVYASFSATEEYVLS